MRRLAAWWMVGMLGCSVAPARDSGTGDFDLPDNGRDSVEEETDTSRVDAPAPDPHEETGTLDAGCPGGLRPWQCLAAGDCGEGMECSEPVPCRNGDCPGACTAVSDRGPGYPGACMWLAGVRPCSGSDRCPSGTGCFPCGPGDLGICRTLPPVPGACWQDQDCPVTKKCIGEVRCEVSRWTPCRDHPGLCLPPPGPPSCLEDEDCPEGEWCDGALLCAIGDSSCADRPGTCRAGASPGCLQNADCVGSPNGPVCLATMIGMPGYCIPGPGLHQGECWQDGEAFCGGDAPACHGAAPCPPGRRCRASGMHGGACGTFPAAGEEGVRIEVLRRTNPETLFVIRNLGVEAIVVPTCDTLLMQTQKDGEWPQDGTFTGVASDALCGSPDAPTSLRIPAGGVRLIRGLEEMISLPSPKRMLLSFRMGCDGRDPDGGVCAVLDRVAHSEAFQ